MTSLSRCARLLAALSIAAAGAVHLRAQIGTNHPATGPYSPASQSSWGSANWPLGATFTAGPGSTLEVGVFSANATQIVLEIYTQDTGADAQYDYLMTKGPDNIWRAAVSGAPNLTLYAFRAWGPNWTYNSAWARGNSSAGFVSDCDSSGNRFNPNKVLFDPYARELSHNTWTPAMAGSNQNYNMYTSGGANISSTQTYAGPLATGTVDCRNVDTGHWAPKAVALVDGTSTGTKPGIAEKDAIIYESHVKGLTAHPSSASLTTLLSSYSGFQDAANIPANLQGTYAGAALMAGYLKDLGFNTIELLPVHETDNADDSTTAPSTSGGGYWAYFTYGFFAPDRRYSSDQTLGGPTREFKNMVAAFHAAGIQVYLDVVYNHSGEGATWDSTNEQAEITFFRGLDNSSYYTLGPGAPQAYTNYTGVGTSINGGSAPVQRLVIDSLNYWTNTMGIDGYRFDEAAELGRDGNSGFSNSATLLEDIATFASQNNVKIIAEPWDGQDGGEIGNFPAGWACWNGNYRDSIRQYMTGNVTGYGSGAGDLSYANAFFGDMTKMQAEGGPQKSINYIVCHDGYNMTDLVSYASPVTDLVWPFGFEQNGGNDNNSSWGSNPTLRRQAIRDFWTYQMFSRGVPMMIWGDEMGRTVNGNNNSYNIDSVATWNNYNMLATTSPDAIATGDLTGGTMPYDNNLGTFAGPANTNPNFAFLQHLLHLRAAHPALRQGDFTSESITFSNANGTGSFVPTQTASVEIFMNGSQVGDDDFIVLSNMATSAATYTVPPGPAGTHWAQVIDTSNASEGTSNFWTTFTGAVVSGSISVAAQSITVLETVAPTPVFTQQPISVTVAGGTVALSAAASNSPAYQWYFNGVALSNGTEVSGATDAILVLSNVTSAQAGSYYCVATNPSGTAQSSSATLTVSAASTPSRLTNISCRAQAGTGGSIIIAGFVVGGLGTSGDLSVLIRGTGPTLGQSPYKVPAVLPDPQLELYKGNPDGTSTLQQTVGAWGGNALIASTAASVGAFSWPLASLDSAILASLPESGYTAQVAGKSGDTGVALVEAYDATPAGTYTLASPRLTNLSARVQVGTGANVVFAGFVIAGPTAKTVLIRASGPTLGMAFSVPGTLSDPALTLNNVTTATTVVVASNTAWDGDPQIATTASQVGAFPWGPSSLDSAILITLPPGNYTAGVAGASGDTGVSLVEVYEVP
jgi:glycogen operon protein